MRVHYSFLLLPILFFYLQTEGQQPTIDSIKKSLSLQKTDSARVESLLNISREFMSNSADSSFKYASEAAQLARQSGYMAGAAMAVKTLGNIRYVQGNYVEAIQYWEEAHLTYDSIGDKTGVSTVLSNIGVIYYNQGDKIKALDYYLRSLKVAEENKLKLREAIALNNLGTVYHDNPETHDKALDYFLKALPMLEELGDMDAYGTTATNLGEIYSTRNDEKTAMVYFDKALKAFTDSISMSYTLNKMGNLYFKKNQLDKAIEYHLQAYNMTLKLDAKLEMAESLIGLADAYREQGFFQTAISSYQQAEIFARETNSFNQLENIYGGLAKSYELKKDFTNALKYQNLYSSVKDSIYNASADQRLSRLIFNFEIEKKENEIDLLTRDKQLKELEINRQKLAKNASLIGLLVIVAFAVMLYRNYRMKARTNAILDKKNEEIEKLLLNILPAEVANELKTEGVATPKYFEQVSVLFTDFKSFTKMADVLSPQELLAELNECFIAFDDIITKYRLEKIKTIGDSYMCAGGIPSPDPNHVKKIVAAAFEIIQYMESWNKQRAKKNLAPWELRVGIHVGPVVAGVVGKTKYAYDIWGSTVNIASRMESNGEPGQVNVSENIYELIKSDYPCTYRGKITAKNIGEIDMYFVQPTTHQNKLGLSLEAFPL
ncbi:tetratricopeptide repeat protein [Flavihumibacter sp. RY-1]|uniref:Tetratricopeptide repeat protein n=1 Tax=Flavihumibacter fluminis TaxID=2909236 RepID=A0ABS9BGT1_9BACT|nr:adenylate/guanylate cyclase domain-containing protein [Flavihumibacter fluminis]MCF1714348.1 tetratricopeptide repeat protein [Flavihumibacter fluminis]